jgi:hypothetical protein
MARMKASAMRYVCKACRSKFRPNRTDAEFCSKKCKQSAYRAREKVSINAAREKTKDQQPYADLYGDHRGFAALLRAQARRYDLKLRFMGTPHGILAVEETPGALAACYGCLGLGGPWRETRFRSTDREVVEILLQPQFGGSFTQRECEKECRDFLLKEARQVSLFTYDWYHYLATCTPQSLPSWDDERPDQPEDDGFSSKQVKALLAGGGYRVGKAT